MLFVLLDCIVVMALHRLHADPEFTVQPGLRQIQYLVLLDTRARPNQLLLNVLQVSMLNLVSSSLNVTLVHPTLSAQLLPQHLALSVQPVLFQPIQHQAHRLAWPLSGVNSRS
jgi:hypothetical protein